MAAVRCRKTSLFIGSFCSVNVQRVLLGGFPLGMLCPDVGQHIPGSGGSWRGSRWTWSTPGAAQGIEEGNKEFRAQPIENYNHLWVSLGMELNSPWFVLLPRKVLCHHSHFITRQLSNYPWGNQDRKAARVFCWKIDSQLSLSLLGFGNAFLLLNTCFEAQVQ